MRQVAVAIRTTGQAPAQGARISELAAIQIIGNVVGRSQHWRIAADAAVVRTDGIVTFAEAYAAWTEFVGGAAVIVHDYYDFKRFIRADCKHAGIEFAIKSDRAPIDTWLLAKQRFPRQRHDLSSVARRLAVQTDSSPANDANDALSAVRLLVEVSRRLTAGGESHDIGGVDAMTGAATVVPSPVVESANESQVRFPLAQRTFGERVKVCWRVLIGQA